MPSNEVMKQREGHAARALAGFNRRSKIARLATQAVSGMPRDASGEFTYVVPAAGLGADDILLLAASVVNLLREEGFEARHIGSGHLAIDWPKAGRSAQGG